jgi:hypothetical protein
MPDLRLRWSETEATKPYARPFMVSFLDDAGSAVGSVAVGGADLLYYRQFQAAVLALAGELFVDQLVETAADPQRAWLDRLAGALPDAGAATVTPASSFDHHEGRRFAFTVTCGGGAIARVDARSLVEYQEFQAAIAHQTGHLYRDAAVEGVDDALHRQAAWMTALRERLARPDPAEAMNQEWPWR